MNSRDYFDAIGAGWDRMREGFFPDRVRDRALALAAVEPGRRAADLGAGTGFLTEGLLARGIQVIAVDQSPVMLEALGRKFPGSPLLDCRAGEAERLPIDDASIDYCLANMYLHHVERPAVAIAEMARILVPGGIAVVTDLDTHDFTFLRDEHHDRWMGFDRGEVRAWFAGAGLTGARVDGIGDECRATSTGGCHAAVGIFIASGRKG
jgi:ubiquinone/menaquinone biosynthesis C-methylase UbiE